MKKKKTIRLYRSDIARTYRDHRGKHMVCAVVFWGTVKRTTEPRHIRDLPRTIDVTVSTEWRRGAVGFRVDFGDLSWIELIGKQGAELVYPSVTKWLSKNFPGHFEFWVSARVVTNAKEIV